MKLHSSDLVENASTSRDSAILQNLDLVDRMARRFQQRVPPNVTYDDLSSVGMIGLLQAADRFDHSRGLKFKTYAQHRVRGAMQDFLREQDPLSRAERKRVRQSASTAGDFPNAMAAVSLDQIHPRFLTATGSTAFALRSELESARA